MTVIVRFAIVSVVALAWTGVALPQDKKAPDPSEEDARMDRIIERWIEQNETERDRVFREVARGGADPKVADDFDQWFTRLGGDDEGWDRTRIQRNSAREIFDRIARDFELKGPVLTRKQFVNYARQYWRKDKSPLWRMPPAFDTLNEADSLFKRLDRDRDGYLSEAEMSPSLRGNLKRWDRNRDGWVHVDEYRIYFAHRLDRVYGEKQQRADRALPPLQISVPEDEEPKVIRAGNLPTGLPAWFDQLDSDRDGQVALFEWRGATWPLDEYQKLDSNDDGFLEPREILRLLAITERDGSRPFAYLLQKRVVAKK